MIKIGIHLCYWTKNWSDDLLPLISRAKKCTFDGVDIPLLAPLDIDVPRLKEALAFHGLAATCGTGLSPEMDISSPDPKVQQKGIEHLKRCLETSEKLGSTVLGGVIYVPWGTFPRQLDLRPFWERSAMNMRTVARTAEDYGVDLCVELLNRFETYMLNTVEQGLAYLNDVGSSRVKLHLDTFHANIEEDDIGGAIRLAGANLGHLHCSENNRKLPGKGHIPWGQVGQALREINYRGWAQIESFVTPGCQVGQGTYTWRPLAEDLDTEARAGAELLRNNFR